MFSYPVEFFQILITQTLILVQRFLFFATLVTLLSAITIYLNNPQVFKTSLPSYKNKNDFCYNSVDNDILTNSHWSFSSTGDAASKCKVKKFYGIIKKKILHNSENKTKFS